MAKTVGGIPTDSEGNIVGKPAARKVHKIKEVDWPTTVVDTRRKRIARSLWG